MSNKSDENKAEQPPAVWVSKRRVGRGSVGPAAEEDVVSSLEHEAEEQILIESEEVPNDGNT